MPAEASMPFHEAEHTLLTEGWRKALWFSGAAMPGSIAEDFREVGACRGVLIEGLPAQWRSWSAGARGEFCVYAGEHFTAVYRRQP